MNLCEGFLLLLLLLFLLDLANEARPVVSIKALMRQVFCVDSWLASSCPPNVTSLKLTAFYRENEKRVK